MSTKRQLMEEMKDLIYLYAKNLTISICILYILPVQVFVNSYANSQQFSSSLFIAMGILYAYFYGLIVFYECFIYSRE